MRASIAIAALAAGVVVGASGAVPAQDLPPTFELDGMPITPHQAQLLGTSGMHEQPAASTETLDGMPASPHQLLVLRNGHRRTTQRP